jgi:hypothetical protein
MPKSRKITEKIEKADKEVQESVDARANARKEAEEAKAAVEEVVEAIQEEEKSTVRFAAHPGYTLVRGSDEIDFPYETDDEELIEKIKKGRGFRAGEIWIDERTEQESEAAEEALSGLSYVKLQRMVSALGYRNVGKYKKIELIDILSNSKLGG